MEDMLEVFFVLIAIGASAVSSAMKAKKKSQAALSRRQAAAPKQEPAPAKAEHPYTPAQPAPAQITFLPPQDTPDAPSRVIEPTVHTHVQPDCDTHDAPSGSLGVKSPEGKDPCHEPQLTHARFVQEPEEEEVGLTFDWSGENMVKAFVMQEILTRPCQRQAR